MGRRRIYTDSKSSCSMSVLKRSPWLPGTATCLWATTALCLLDAEALLIPTGALSIRSKVQGTTWRGFREARRTRAAASTGGRTWYGQESGAGVWNFGGCESSWVGRGGRRSRKGHWQRRVAVGARGRRGGACTSGAIWGISGCMMSVWDHQTSEEWEFEEEVQRLERKLERAVDKEKYELAAKIRDKLSRMHIDDSSAVLSINSAFYAAYSAADAGRMAGLWLPSDDVTCVQPWNTQFVGHEAVTQSWVSLFADLQDGGVITVRISVSGTTALVRCVEEVSKGKAGRSQMASRMKGTFSKSARAVGGAGTAGGGGSSAARAGISGRKVKRSKGNPTRFAATNIYRKAGGRWYMVHHHATFSDQEKQWTEEDEAREKTLPMQRQLTRLSDDLMKDSNNALPGQADYLDFVVDNISKLPISSKSMAAFNLGGLLGGGGSEDTRVYFIKAGGSRDGDDEDEEEDHDGDDDHDDHDSEESRDFEADHHFDVKLIDGQLTLRQRVGPPELESQSDDDDDEDEDAEDAEDAIVQIGQGEQADDDDDDNTSLLFTDNITRKTIQTLRMLGEENRLSKKEQRRLTADLIKHATSENASQVEVAYELLLAHHNEGLQDTDSVEEFVQQCKIMAAALFDEDRRNGNKE